MRGEKALFVANFVCRFGEDLVLLDLFREIVVEAFLKPGRERTYANKKYFFFKPQLLDLTAHGKVEKAIAGRLIKQTTVGREQVLRDGELVQDIQELESAPSSLFVLLLSNHKLLLVRETRDAPGLEAFESTARRFIFDAHREYLDTLREAIGEQGERVTNAELLAQVPKPTVEVVPLSTGSSLELFIGRFATLSSVQVRLVEPNDELDNAALFEHIRDAKEETGATSATLELKNGSQEGLDKEAVVELLEDPVSQGNSKIKLAGKDQNGESLRGNNEDFKLIVPIDLNVDTIKQAAIKIYNKFKSIQGLLKIPELTEDQKEKLKNIGS
jgi:hypothetical protein